VKNIENSTLGLKENWRQFTLLVIVNAFVGGMIGMERSIFPQFAEQEFGVSSKTAILSFITAFGISKAIANYFTGKLANRLGRRSLLLIGWILALPIPFILISANSWSWVIFGNVLLGISQGLTWSSTVVMKIDLVGEKDRGFAMGLNEFAGYLAVGLVAFLTGYIANQYGITPYPFYVGIVISILGFFLTVFWVKDTRRFVQEECLNDTSPPLKNVFIETTFKNKTLSSVSQAGLINTLNDGMIWGLLPIVLLRLHFNNTELGIITAIYPSVWGFGQIFTGKMADQYSKKSMLFWGMFLQAVAILMLPASHGFTLLAFLSSVLGIGTALVYPTFLSTIAQATRPNQRAESIGTFRFWRDLGYAIGAIISGITADYLGIDYAIYMIGSLTMISALIIHFRMPAKIGSIRECIDKEEILQSAENWQIIDVTDKKEFEDLHIQEAIHIELADLKDAQTRLDKNRLYVTTCAKGGLRSAEAAKILKEMGLRAKWLCGGTQKWLEING
jgi:MFS family permease